jgi:uncharacterized coiled-coil protein SlyX
MSHEPSALESRLVDLEVRYMHLERQVTELNQVVFDQHKLIEHLRQELSAQRRNLEAIGDPVVNERPPHY